MFGDFRYDFIPLLGKTAASADIIIAGDNNGSTASTSARVIIGSRVKSMLRSAQKTVFGVELENLPPASPEVLISAIQVTYTDGTAQTIATDDTWSPPYNDAGWPNAVVMGNASSSPWRTPTLQRPTSSSTLSGSNSI